MRTMTASLRFFVATLAIVLSGSARAADSATVTAQANVLSVSRCEFGADATLNFGLLDPVAHPDVTVGTTLQFRCLGAGPGGLTMVIVYGITDNDGLWETGPNANRMRRTTGAAFFMPYTLEMPSPGFIIKPLTPPWSAWQTLNITGTLLGTSYMGLPAGIYRDTVIVSIVP